MIEDMIGKLQTMLPYFEDPPGGTLQLQFVKTYNQVDGLYQQWLQSPDEEKQVLPVEEEWIEDDEVTSTP